MGRSGTSGILSPGTVTFHRHSQGAQLLPCYPLSPGRPASAKSEKSSEGHRVHCLWWRCVVTGKSVGVVAIVILSDCFCWWLVVESLTLAAVGWAPVRTMATSTTSPSTHTWAVRFLAYFDAPPLASPETALAASSGGAHDIEGRYLSSATAPPIFFCRAASARLESADHRSPAAKQPSRPRVLLHRGGHPLHLVPAHARPMLVHCYLHHCRCR